MIFTSNEFIKHLQDKNLSQVARDCDMSYPTILKIASGDIASSQYQTLEKITKYLQGQNHDTLPKIQ